MSRAVKGFHQQKGTLVPDAAPLRILQMVADTGGRISRRELTRFARAVAGGHNGNVALLRLQESGLVVLEYRLTRAGRARLRSLA